MIEILKPFFLRLVRRSTSRSRLLPTDEQLPFDELRFQHMGDGSFWLRYYLEGDEVARSASPPLKPGDTFQVLGIKGSIGITT